MCRLWNLLQLYNGILCKVSQMQSPYQLCNLSTSISSLWVTISQVPHTCMVGLYAPVLVTRWCVVFYLFNKFISSFCFCTSHVPGEPAHKDPQIYLLSFKGFLKGVLSQHFQIAGNCLRTWPVLITSASSCFLPSALSVKQLYFFSHLDCNISEREVLSFFLPPWYGIHRCC